MGSDDTPEDDLDGLRSQIGRLARRLRELEERARRSHLGVIEDVRGARRRRGAIFDSLLFGDPCWDLLVEIYAAELEDRALRVTKLCTSVGVPLSTGLRCIDRLEAEGWARRTPEPGYRRRVLVTLTERASAAMRSYFDSLRPAAVERSPGGRP